jgi:hypothetical protein
MAWVTIALALKWRETCEFQRLENAIRKVKCRLWYGAYGWDVSYWSNDNMGSRGNKNSEYLLIQDIAVLFNCNDLRERHSERKTE